MSNDQYDVESVNVQVDERKDDDAHYLEFRFPENTKFQNTTELFQALRDLVTDHFGGSFWMIKMSSRVTCSNMPILHDPVNLRILIDILQPIRDPAMEVQRIGFIRLYFAPSKAHFFRKKVHAKPVRVSNQSENRPDTFGSSTE